MRSGPGLETAGPRPGENVPSRNVGRSADTCLAPDAKNWTELNYSLSVNVLMGLDPTFMVVYRRAIIR